MPILHGSTLSGGQALGPAASPTFREIWMTAASGSTSGTLSTDSLGNGMKSQYKWWSGVVTITTSADSFTSNTLPANCIVWTVFFRVTVAVPAPTSYIDALDESIGTSFVSPYAPSSAVDSVQIGQGNCPLSRYGFAAGRIKLTPDVAPGSATGRIHVLAIFEDLTTFTS